jgi:hypothetical protein
MFFFFPRLDSGKEEGERRAALMGWMDGWMDGMGWDGMADEGVSKTRDGGWGWVQRRGGYDVCWEGMDMDMDMDIDVDDIGVDGCAGELVSGGWWVVGGDLFCRDQEEEVMAMAKVFCKTPSKSGGKVGKWERCPLKDCISPEPAVKSKTPGRPSDRFITDRSAMDFNIASFRLGMKENSFTDAVHSPSKEEYKKQLAENLLNVENGQKQTRILAFKSKPPPPPEGFDNGRKLLYSQNLAGGQTKPRKMFRHIPQAAERTLDAPDLLDDYYLNLLDWSVNNILAVALGSTVYLWDATTSSIEELLTVDEEGPVTSISWAPDGKYIAVGLNNATVQLWDSQSLRLLRTLRGHTARVGSLAWNGPTLTTGGRDTLILNHDGTDSLTHPYVITPDFMRSGFLW